MKFKIKITDSVIAYSGTKPGEVYMARRVVSQDNLHYVFKDKSGQELHIPCWAAKVIE